MLVSLDAAKAIEHTRPPGYLDSLIRSGDPRVEPGIGEVIDIPDDRYWQLVREYSPDDFHARISLYCCGPGCQLKRSLSWWGIRSGGGCGCDSYAAQMDQWGPDGCEARIDEIVSHLVAEAAKRSVILGAIPAAAVLVLVRRAIDAARREVAHAETSGQKEAGPDMVGPR